jgi:hypothetical protein
MSNLLDTLITIIVGSFSGVTRGLSDRVSSLEDFFYVKFRGLSFIVLGSRQTGKTTLIEWLRRNMASIENFEPDPTTAGGDAVSDFSARVDASDNFMRLKPNRDVGGEYAMWETDWTELFREAQPRGIIFMLDHTDAHLQKDALNFVLQMIEDEPQAAKQLKAFYILVNKADIWGEEKTLDDIMQDYRNEQKRLRTQAERVGYKWSISQGSLVTGKGVKETMRKFFNAIRPRPKA